MYVRKGPFLRKQFGSYNINKQQQQQTTTAAAAAAAAAEQQQKTIIKVTPSIPVMRSLVMLR